MVVWLSTSVSARLWASLRSSHETHGTFFIPRFFAAVIRACPATTSGRPSAFRQTITGFLKPNSLIEASTASICSLVCFFALFSYGTSESISISSIFSSFSRIVASPSGVS